MSKEFPKLSKYDQANLLGYAKYMGYEFDYSPEKKRAVLVKTDNGERNILFLAKVNGKIIGVNKNGDKESLTSAMNLTRLMNKMGIFKIPKDADIGINQYILDSLTAVGIK